MGMVCSERQYLALLILEPNIKGCVMKKILSPKTPEKRLLDLEGSKVEYKRELTREVVKSVIGLMNADGGEIFIGIEDDGSICGVDDPDEVLLQVTSLLRDSIRPDALMFISCDPVKHVVRILVLKGTRKPYYLAAKGNRPEGVYVRRGAATIPASPDLIYELLRQTEGGDFESETALRQDLTFNALQEHFQRRGIDLTEESKRTLGIIGPQGSYTNLAMLLSDQCVHQIKIATFNGNDFDKISTRYEASGSVLSQLDVVFDILKRNQAIISNIRGLVRDDFETYPEVALREALVNAIVHRDYSYSGPIRIDIFSDRMEFMNFGRLMKGLTVDDIGFGLSELRNQKLAAIFYRLGYIEAYGTGLRSIQEKYRESMTKPSIEVSNNGFKLTLPKFVIEEFCEVNKKGGSGRKKMVGESRVSDHQPKSASDRFADFCNEHAEFTRQQLQDELGVSQTTANNLIRRRIDSGEIRKSRVGRFIKYEVLKQCSDQTSD